MLLWLPAKADTGGDLEVRAMLHIPSPPSISLLARLPLSLCLLSVTASDLDIRSGC